MPPQLALYVLSFLEPRDLLRAAQTCRYWRVLAEDNLLWREKCREEGRDTSCMGREALPGRGAGHSPTAALPPAGIEEPLNLRKRRLLSPGFMYSPWKFAFMRQHRIDMNWRSGELRAPKVGVPRVPDEDRAGAVMRRRLLQGAGSQNSVRSFRAPGETVPGSGLSSGGPASSSHLQTLGREGCPSCGCCQRLAAPVRAAEQTHNQAVGQPVPGSPWW